MVLYINDEIAHICSHLHNVYICAVVLLGLICGKHFIANRTEMICLQCIRT